MSLLLLLNNPGAAPAAIGGWGGTTWGAGSPWGTGSAAPPPTLVSASPSVVERRGGTVVALFGSNFQDPLTVELLQGGVVIADGYIFDPRFDLTRNRVYVGMPALDDGVYDVRVTTDGGTATALGIIEAKLHAEEHRVVANRAKWAQPWDVGERYLSR